ncbi:inosine/xanthosine triphosphatase [Jiulongibacter sediminis]|uniref:Probable inosine/xanthosine triphosphatase n=1 Tax=Jiulongibacter sediminis TaxID=1605367 RepID=A0A0P7C577_9BACT|nr:inosine/xanthosine triphosphatase [Jiulongibacter sediminis]KPM49923.1 inositol monophosphatase [Jiulongibacter sediminis]TBX26960.1 inositol monophosphatase [Jiulongibacter sediminis]
MIVCVASKNPTKTESAKDGFQRQFPEEEIEIISVSVPSGVPDQPIGSDETYKGALNRAQNAKKECPEADYWIGIEGGNILHGQEMEAMAWVVVLSHSKIGRARTAGFFLPQKTVDLINEGYELGHADEIVFEIKNSKQKMGSSGLLTDGLISRKELYVPAVIFALSPFKKIDLYP